MSLLLSDYYFLSQLSLLLAHGSRVKATMLRVICSFWTARKLVTGELDENGCYKLQLPNGK